MTAHKAFGPETVRRQGAGRREDGHGTAHPQERPAGHPPGPAEPRARRRYRRRHLSPLTLHVLAVNMLALIILLAGLLYLGRYQDRLIEAELDTLRTEARLFAGALGEGAVTRTPDETFTLAHDQARQMVRRLVETTETRTRLFDHAGRLVADSRMLFGPAGVIRVETLPPPSGQEGPAHFLADLYDRLVNALPTRDHLPLYRGDAEHGAVRYADIQRALAGEMMSGAWKTENGDMLLTVAMPVQRYKQVLGAVLLSRTGAEIDRAIRQVRIDILKVFLVALGITVLLSFYLAGTIARPIRRLAMAAETVRHGHGRHHLLPDFTGRRDEIGDLSGALREMTEALWTRMDAIERFAADVAHEIKNPLTSLRSAVETAARVRDPQQQRRLMAIIEDDVQRLDRLISDISNASRLDAELSRAELEPVDLGQMLVMLAEIHSTTSTGDGAPHLEVTLPRDADLTVQGLEGRLVQVFQNVVANALSFSPPGGVVHLVARVDDGTIEVRIRDEGPGLPESKLDAIFDRFYTERPAGEKFGTHSGLGLSISKQIVEAHGGTIRAGNLRDAEGRISGAEFTIRLPHG